MLGLDSSLRWNDITRACHYSEGWNPVITKKILTFLYNMPLACEVRG